MFNIPYPMTHSIKNSININIITKNNLILMQFHLVLVFNLLLQMWGYQIQFALNCGLHTYTLLATKYFNFTIDSFYESVTSVSETKPSLPDGIFHPHDRELLKTHRTSAPSFNTFSYRPTVDSSNNYIILMHFIETEYKTKGERIFNILLGDDVIHTVDIVGQVGYGRVLHKYIMFDLSGQILYLNSTLPILNGYNFKTRQVRIGFQGIKGKPKVESLILIKGEDATKYLYQYLQFEQEKNVKVREFVSEKYRKQPKLSYRPLLATDLVPEPVSEIRRICEKYLNWRYLCCALCGIMAVHYEKILSELVERMAKIKTIIHRVLSHVFRKRKQE